VLCAGLIGGKLVKFAKFFDSTKTHVTQIKCKRIPNKFVKDFVFFPHYRHFNNAGELFAWMPKMH